MSAPPDQLTALLYKGYQNDKSYVRYPGRLILPLADGRPVVIRTHQEYTSVTTVYSGKKLGTPPVAPRPLNSDILIDGSHFLPLPTPVQAELGSAWMYSMAGQFTVIETEPSLPTTGFAYGQYPFRLEPFCTMMERGGYSSGFEAQLTTDPTPPASPRLNDPTYVWPQALQMPKEFFSTVIA